MAESMALEVADIYEALGEHDRAALLRWGGQSPADRLRDLEDALEAERERADDSVEMQGDLAAEVREMRTAVEAVRKVLDRLPDLIDQAANEDDHATCDECALTRLMVAVDEARAEVRAALR